MKNDTGNVETLDAVLLLLGIPCCVLVIDNSELPSLVYVVCIDDLSLENHRRLVGLIVICRGKNGDLNLCICRILREVVDTGIGVNGSDESVAVIVLRDVTLAVNLGELYVLAVLLDGNSYNREEVGKLNDVKFLVENCEEGLELELVFVTDNVGLIAECKLTGKSGCTVCSRACGSVCALEGSDAEGLFELCYYESFRLLFRGNYRLCSNGYFNLYFLLNEKVRIIEGDAYLLFTRGCCYVIFCFLRFQRDDKRC